MEKKLGHQAPKGWRKNRFNSIEINGDFAYCKSHNFVYNTIIEEEKLYNGLPCYHTDVRFINTSHNYFMCCYLHWTRWKDISLKACIRKTLDCKNIPINTVVRFCNSWYFSGKKIDNSYIFKIKKENNLDINFEINHPNFFKNFSTCEFSKNLTNELRKNGFIVDVKSRNQNFISGMIATAAAYTGRNVEADNEDGEIAIAYGFGKKIGFSSSNNNFIGYSNGCENILFDYFGEFDKWSRCCEISKTTSIEQIINILKEPKNEN